MNLDHEAAKRVARKAVGTGRCLKKRKTSFSEAFMIVEPNLKDRRI